MFSSLAAVENYLQELVPKTFKIQFTAEKGIIRTKEYLKLMGSPQNTLKVIHVAGTSGKGSTSFMISKLLVSQGFKVGLHLSPHLIDIRERTEINNTLLDEKKYCSYFNEIIPFIEKMKHSSFGTLTYFEAMAGFAFYVFAKEKVDYAVMETGMGGKFDGTNVVDRPDKLVVITKIGFDHTKILGNTLSKIAYQKAMICVERGDVITTKQFPTVAIEIQKIVQEKQGHLFQTHVRVRNPTKRVLRPVGLDFSGMPRNDNLDLWSNMQFEDSTLGLQGEYQKENAALALTTLFYLSKRDGFPIRNDSIRSTMKDMRFRGRFDVLEKKGGIVILDGAHNAQKMKAFLSSVKLAYPHKKFTFIIAFKKGKDYKKMLQYILGFAQKIIITRIFSESQDLLHQSVSPADIKGELNRLGFTNTHTFFESKDVMKIINKEGDSCIVTGSLYLLGDIYKLLKKAV